jgi:hypothetical protein
LKILGFGATKRKKFIFIFKKNNFISKGLEGSQAHVYTKIIKIIKFLE